MESATPVLIVNADDLGYNRPTTDAIAECFRAGRITSATAMVHMRDSDRAAQVARELGLPVGLHLNLSEPLDDPAVPPDVRGRHLDLVRRYGSPSFIHRSRRWTFDPRLREPTERCVADQLERFEELYGRPPTHIDGHLHVHICPNVALARTIPSGLKMRNALSGAGLGTGLRSRVVRARQRLLLGDRLTTGRFLNITGLHPEFVEGGVRRLLGLSREGSVEVMAHPGFGHEYTQLMSDDWGRWTEGLPLGSYDDLG
jgi:chitin disaccharide deacetylase